MQPFWRRLIVLLVALALVIGGVLGVATPFAAAAEPCPNQHEHGLMHEEMPGHHHHEGQGHDQRACLHCCCLGISVSVPTLPPSVTVASTATPVVYWDTSPVIAGRSIGPDLGPPRPLG